MMKLKLAYIFLFLLAAGSAYSSVDASKTVAKIAGKKYIARASDVVCGVKPTDELQAASAAPDSKDQSTGKRYIKIAPEAAIHASIAPACNAFLNLIAIIHLDSLESFPPTIDRPGQQVLFRVLFRVIISPNAP